jgi:hypothetical protein
MRRLQLVQTAKAMEEGVAATGAKVFRWHAGHAVFGCEMSREMSNGNT